MKSSPHCWKGDLLQLALEEEEETSFFLENFGIHSSS